MNSSAISAACQGHFGELLQGVFVDNQGERVRGLVTLPCPQLESRAELIWCPDRTTAFIKPNKPKVAAITELYCHKHDLNVGFQLEIISNIPVAMGMGSSTADLVAAVRVLDQAFELETDAGTLLQWILQVEKACDPAMFSGNALLFAQREGRVVEHFAAPLPPFWVCGFDLMPGETFVTDQVAVAEYCEADLLRFTELRVQLRSAIQQQNVGKVAQVATQSAIINQRYFPKAGFEALLDLQKQSQALGVCIAHSGTVGGLIFPVGKQDFPSGGMLLSVS